MFHHLGQGLPIDRVEAQKWYYILEVLRPDDEPFLSVVNANYMTEDQVIEARALADAWLADRD